MRRVRVKICGVTRREDAEAAVRAGADAIGFVLWPGSPRAVGPADARRIGGVLPPFVTRVGVFVDATPDEVTSIAEEAALDVVQLHGAEDPRDFAGRRWRLLKSVALTTEADVERASAEPAVALPLVDAYDPARHGGTGRIARWDLARRLSERRPIVLAGGLDADNVGRAIREVRPWAIDVSSGVEIAPGVKSAARLDALFAAIRIAALEPS